MEDFSFEEVTNKFWTRYFLVCIAVLVLAYFVNDYRWKAVIASPLVAFLFRPMWLGRGAVGAVSALATDASERALEAWQGRYYSWSNLQIRVFDTGNVAWVLEQDLMRAAGVKPTARLRDELELSFPGYGVIPGTSLRGFNESAVLEFLESRQQRNPEILKLKLWFEREVFFPIRQKRKDGSGAQGRG